MRSSAREQSAPRAARIRMRRQPLVYATRGVSRLDSRAETARTPARQRRARRAMACRSVARLLRFSSTNVPMLLRTRSAGYSTTNDWLSAFANAARYAQRTSPGTARRTPCFPPTLRSPAPHRRVSFGISSSRCSQAKIHRPARQFRLRRSRETRQLIDSPRARVNAGSNWRVVNCSRERASSRNIS
jgi:hypothetical protein